MKISTLIEELESIQNIQGDIDVASTRSEYVGERICTPIVSVTFQADQYITDSESKSERANDGVAKVICILN